MSDCCLFVCLSVCLFVISLGAQPFIPAKLVHACISLHPCSFTAYLPSLPMLALTHLELAVPDPGQRVAVELFADDAVDAIGLGDLGRALVNAGHVSVHFLRVIALHCILKHCRWRKTVTGIVCECSAGWAGGGAKGMWSICDCACVGAWVHGCTGARVRGCVAARVCACVCICVNCSRASDRYLCAGPHP